MSRWDGFNAHVAKQFGGPKPRPTSEALMDQAYADEPRQPNRILTRAEAEERVGWVIASLFVFWLGIDAPGAMK